MNEFMDLDMREPLLTREEEQKIFQEIERVERELFGRLVSTPRGREVLASLAERSRDHDCEVSDALDDLKLGELPSVRGKRKKEAQTEELVDRLFASCNEIGGLREWIREACLEDGGFVDLVGEADSRKSLVLRKNLRFVRALAQAHVRFTRNLTIWDLFQEGCLGCLKAIDRFDWRRGNKFSTYASWWIKHALKRAIQDRDRGIRIPVHLQDATSKLRRCLIRFRSSQGREPSIEEMCDMLGVSPHKLQRIIEANSATIYSLDVAMQAPEGADGSTPGQPILYPDPDAPDGLELIHDEEVRQKVREGLNCLSAKEKLIVELRFALKGGDPLTLQEIGDMYSLSRERIRQLQSRAFHKLRKFRPGLQDLI